ncbi:MAG: superoxide dismutase [Fe], partial [Gammaproteobacteria bacterium]|nr:superoxide dismutase [Fe] [Gammaproteobacteria bacterium]
MAFTLPKLPYERSALEPYISAETLEYHYGKHHNGYVTKLNKLIENTEYADKSLEDIIRSAFGGVFNNAAQAWNHAFYWKCLSANKNQEPSPQLLKAIQKSFGSLENFKEKFVATGMSTFGSGWVWLIKKSDESIAIESTSNAGNPLTEDKQPLLTCDVWEH